jgi:hypothetical protein
MTVEQLLDQIEKLAPNDRFWLEQRLAESNDREDEREITALRAIARQRGIDQAAIDSAVHDVRYGS